MENNIIKEIKKLKKDVCPRPEWITLSRDILLQQVDPKNQHQTAGIGLNGYVQLFTQVFKQRLLQPAVVMLLVLGVFLGSSLTINAAFYSLPGDRLYKVKIALERTHAALIPGEENKVELKMEFAQKRVAELNKIMSQVDVSPEVKKKKIEVVVQEFKNNVVAVNNHLNRIKEADDEATDAEKEQTVKMALTISSKTQDLAKSFDEKIDELSAAEQLEVEEIVADAVNSAQEASLSAQEIVADAEAATEEEEEEVVEGEEDEDIEGVIEGVEVAEDDLEEDITEPDSNEDFDEDEETVESTTIEEVEEEVVE